MGKYKYQKIPMVLLNNPYIFHENVSELFYGFDMVCAYIYNIMVRTKDDSVDHLKFLENILKRILVMHINLSPWVMGY